jgi:Zn-dependent protease
VLADPTGFGLATFDAGLAVLNIIFFFVEINVFLFIFNLLPVPPLDGWRVLLGLVPPRNAWELRRIESQYGQYIPLVFIVFILFLGPKIIGPIATPILRLLVPGF